MPGGDEPQEPVLAVRAHDRSGPPLLRASRARAWPRSRSLIFATVLRMMSTVLSSPWSRAKSSSWVSRNTRHNVSVGLHHRVGLEVVLAHDVLHELHLVVRTPLQDLAHVLRMLLLQRRAPPQIASAAVGVRRPRDSTNVEGDGPGPRWLAHRPQLDRAGAPMPSSSRRGPAPWADAHRSPRWFRGRRRLLAASTAAMARASCPSTGVTTRAAGRSSTRGRRPRPPCRRRPPS